MWRTENLSGYLSMVQNLINWAFLIKYLSCFAHLRIEKGPSVWDESPMLYHDMPKWNSALVHSLESLQIMFHALLILSSLKLITMVFVPIPLVVECALRLSNIICSFFLTKIYDMYSQNVWYVLKLVSLLLLKHNVIHASSHGSHTTLLSRALVDDS